MTLKEIDRSENYIQYEYIVDDQIFKFTRHIKGKRKRFIVLSIAQPIDHPDKITTSIMDRKESKAIRLKYLTQELLDIFPGKYYNTRYNVELNEIAGVIPFNNLDIKHKLYKMRCFKTFTRFWREFINNYDEYEKCLKENLWARQLFLSFLSKHNQLKKLTKKYKWIVDSTEYFYFHGFITKTKTVITPHCVYGTYPPEKYLKYIPKTVDVIENTSTIQYMDTFGVSSDYRCHFDIHTCKKCRFFRQSRTYITMPFIRYASKVKTSDIVSKDLVTIKYPRLEFYNLYWLDMKYPNIIPISENMGRLLSNCGDSKFKNQSQYILANKKSITRSFLQTDGKKYHYFKNKLYKLILNNIELFQDDAKFMIEFEKYGLSII